MTTPRRHDPAVTYLYDHSTGESRFLFRAYPDRDRVAVFEGHGFVNPENSIDLHHAVERFLARHLGA
ncbi:hypothetical protein AB0D49_35890 [Streptomyces sp. NPDC048290]|uniref:hypothetical protein n=1 Tax=Streptomyces sp. NPDC048290 TaxID=3155811 RepID=UPI00341BD812